MKTLALAFVFAAASVYPAELPQSDIEAAIERGVKAKGKPCGLHLSDTGRGFMNALSSMDKNATPGGGGFSVYVYTPLSWICQEASNAAKEYRPFTLESLTDEHRAALLRIVVYPDTPSVVSAEGMHNTSSVQHVVIRDRNKDKTTVVIQPLTKEYFSDVAQNAMGAEMEYLGLTASFDIAALESARKMKKGEFFITVVGESDEKDFKVKSKHFKRLPGVSELGK